MTFLEAAIEILHSAEEPLHFSEIARLAVERKLLSHVGRDPEAAMRTCLNSAVRSKVHDSLVMRSKPGHYKLRPGVELPELPAPPAEAEPLPEADEDEQAQKASKSKPKASKSSTRSKKSKAHEDSDPDEGDASGDGERTRRGSSRRRRKVEPAQVDSAQLALDVEPDESEDSSAEESASAPIPAARLDPSKVRFRGPEGSGLEEDTDIALVMANAMSRLVEERPDLREELEAMQKSQAPAPEVIEVGRRKRREEEQAREGRDEERGGRRRRRRRRRSRRVEWSESSGQRTEASRGEEILDRVAKVLAEAGSRSLHVRQIAENLASQDVLGGEISEIERAVTAAILLDVHHRGAASRFAVRGDARYQLRGNRLPEKAAAAEHAMRAAVRELENETRSQLLLWLQSLGARSLESLVRIWLAREGYALVATLAPSRGLGKLVVEDSEAEEDDGRVLVLIVPRKTSLEPKLWDGEAERNNCASTMVFAMCEPLSELAAGDSRVIFAQDMLQWMVRQGIGLRTLSIPVTVLDADLIESIGGLDT